MPWSLSRLVRSAAASIDAPRLDGFSPSSLGRAGATASHKRHFSSRDSSRVDGRVAGAGNAVAYLTGFVLVACIVLGGGTRSGYLGDVLLQFISVALTFAALRDITLSGSAQHFKWPLAFIGALAFIPVIQLMPLPPGLWAHLPGRETIAETYRLIGRDAPWLPLTMSPTATWLSALAMLPPIAVFLGMLTLDHAHRRAVCALLVAMGIASGVLGFMQTAQGPQSALRIYAFTNNTEAVGFFANRNHFAALLYATMLFTAAWVVDATIAAGLQPRRRRLEFKTILPLVVSLTVFVILIAAQMTARSRAGLGLTIVSLFAAVVLAVSDRRAAATRGFGKIIIGSLAVLIIFFLQLALYRIMDRFGADPLADARIPFARNTITAAMTYMPFGSGLGTFVPVYQLFEKPADIGLTYANHAHNDALEVWLETGIFGPILIGVFFLWLLKRFVPVWSGRLGEPRDIDRGLVRAASIILTLLLVHSLVDYPLRTNAVMAIAALAAALLVSPAQALLQDEMAEDLRPRAGRTDRIRKTEPTFDAGSEGASSRAAGDPHAGGQRKRSEPPRPRELWGQSTEWPEAWRKPDAQTNAPAKKSGDPPKTGG